MKLIIGLAFSLALVIVQSFPNSHSNDGPFDGRIMNGALAQRKAFSYQVGLDVYTFDGQTWCGGSLISTRHVLTAAHCLTEFDAIDVYLGSLNPTAKFEEGRRIFHIRNNSYSINIHENSTYSIHNSSWSVKIHENYTHGYLENDLAVIKLPEQIAPNDFIKPIGLPKSDWTTFIGESGMVSGWGYEDNKHIGVTNKLRYFRTKITERCEVCNPKIEPFNSHTMKLFTSTKFCISNNDKYPTEQDTGGPLVALERGKLVLVGVYLVSFTELCSRNSSAIYTKVTSHLDWIETNMKA